MTTQEARKVFDDAIAQATDPNSIARLELCREYFTNPKFAKALEHHTWELNNQ